MEPVGAKVAGDDRGDEVDGGVELVQVQVEVGELVGGGEGGDGVGAGADGGEGEEVLDLRVHFGGGLGVYSVGLFWKGGKYFLQRKG